MSQTGRAARRIPWKLSSKGFENKLIYFSIHCSIFTWQVQKRAFPGPGQGPPWMVQGQEIRVSELDKAGKEVPLCSCYEHTSRARLQLDGVAAEKRRLCLSRESVNLQLSLANWRTVFSFRFDSYFTLLKLSFVKNYHLSTFITFAKQSMINRLSNPINRNRSAAKISKVMSSNRNPEKFPRN